MHWTAKVTKRYKRNTINDDLNRSYQTNMNFDHDKETIREKYRLTGFPTRFAGNAIHQSHLKLILINKRNMNKLFLSFYFQNPRDLFKLKFHFAWVIKTLQKVFRQITSICSPQIWYCCYVVYQENQKCVPFAR